MNENERRLILEIVNCDDYPKALGNSNHPCSKAVNASVSKGRTQEERQLTPEAWRFHDCSELDEVECIILGWNSGTGQGCSAPSFYDDEETKVNYNYHQIEPSYITNYRHVQEALINKSLPYLKTNLAHCKTEHKISCSYECVEHCAGKYLQKTLDLCRKLKLVLEYDCTEYLNNRYGLHLSLKNRYEKIDSICIILCERCPQGGHLRIPKFKIEGLDC